MKHMGILLIIIGVLCLVMGIYFVARPQETSKTEEATQVANLASTETQSKPEQMDNKEKGVAFEEYIINLLNPADFSLVERVEDYTGRTHYAERNKYPDLVFRDKASNTEFAIECKYRSAWKEYKGQDQVMWVEQEKIDDYNKFSRDRNMPVLVMLGVGGTPEHPAEIFSIPLRLLQKPYPIRKSFVERLRINPDKHILYTTNHHNLTSNPHK